MFDGKVSLTKKYGKTQGSTMHSNADLLEKARKQREDRARDKFRTLAAIRIQALSRGVAGRKHVFQKLRQDFDTSTANVQRMKQLFVSRGQVFIVPLKVLLDMLRSCLFFYHPYIDSHRLAGFTQMYMDSAQTAQAANNIWLAARGAFAAGTSPSGGAGAGAGAQERLYFLLQRLFTICIEAIQASLQANGAAADTGFLQSCARVLASLAAQQPGGPAAAAELGPLQLRLVRHIGATVCACLKYFQLNYRGQAQGQVLHSVFAASGAGAGVGQEAVLRPLVGLVCMSLRRLPMTNTSERVAQQETEAWQAVLAHVLTIPDLKSCSLFAPVLEFLGAGQGQGWDRMIRLGRASHGTANANATGEQGATRGFVLSASDKMFAVFNIFSCYDRAKTNPRWVSLLTSVLCGVPLLGILHHLELGEAPSAMQHIFAEKKEHAHALDGIALLEYRIASCKDGYLLDPALGEELLQVDLDSFRSILDVLLDSTLLQRELVNSVDSMAVEGDAGGGEGEGGEDEHGLGFGLLRSFGKILISCPSLLLNKYTPELQNKCIGSTTNKILTMISFSAPATPLPRQIWLALIERFGLPSITYHVVDSSIELGSAAGGVPGSTAELQETLTLAMFVLFSTLSHQLAVTDDEEFLQGKVLSMEETKTVIHLLKAILYRMYKFPPATQAPTRNGSSSSSSSSSGGPLLQMHLNAISMKLLNQLYYLNSRCLFVPEEFWYWSQVNPADLEVAPTLTADDGPLNNSHMWGVLSSCPQVVPFFSRVAIFQAILERDTASAQGHLGGQFHGGWNGYGTRVQVRRDEIFGDSFRALQQKEVGVLKNRLQIEFTASDGRPEAGIDGGGLFKEFMDSFVKEAFDPKFGLFNPTSSNLLVPNPISEALFEEWTLQYYQFAGKMLGKAMYDCILVEAQFSVIFLNVLLGKLNQFDDLVFLDEQTYRSLKQIKQMSAAGENLEDLDLYFVMQRTDIEGTVVSTDLLPGGSQIRVNRSNVHKYLHHFAYHKLNVEISAQCKAFLSGFRQMIRVEWMKLFSPRELQLMISGEDRGMDIEDWKKNINYGSGYHESQPYVQGFWKIVSEMTFEEQRNLLKFITSCSRHPLRGFSQFTPLICIQKVPQYSQDQFESEEGAMASRLPSAATCMNLLKLPEYDSVEILKEKLLYAIMNNNMGFELS